MSSTIIPFPTEFRPVLPTVVGNVDYSTVRRWVEQIDQLLLSSGMEKKFVELSLNRWLRPGFNPSAREQQRYQLTSRRALRCNLLRIFLQEDFRGFSCQVAGNPLYQWFCLVDAMEQVRVPSKSQMQRFAEWLPEEEMREIHQMLLQGARAEPVKLGLAEALDLDQYFLDTTCLKTNIHFPVDWVLLRDAVGTLMKATLLIRKEGLKGRMEAPEEFLRRINRLSIQMTHQRRQKENKKERKRLLREMKKLVKTVASHARRHRELLDKEWEQTELSRKQAGQILKRIDHILVLLPQAEKQAHERIIGERQVASGEKILSLYETDTRVIVRGKAGAEVEFGNTLLVGENRQGIVLDFQLFKEQSKADSALLMESLMAVWGKFGTKVLAVGADRGFSNKANREALEDSETYDGVCPRQPGLLRERMKDSKFAALQKRRSQTEARISILKNGFLGRPLRAKGFAARELAVSWGILTHNLWMLARMTEAEKKLAKAA